MARYIDADALGIGKADRNAFEIPQYADGWNSAIEIIANAPTADVVPKEEVANKICCEIEEEIVAALESNYRTLKEWDDGRCNDYILEMVNGKQN